MIAINSAKLSRRVYICTTEEARQLWQEKPEERSNIYLESEVEELHAYPNALEWVQSAKDTFPGSIVEAVSIP